jgi:glycosyltransferase involved in cell wall biosynthesis
MLKAFTFRLLRRNHDTAAHRARLRRAIRWQLLAPVAATLRRSALAALSWWPLASPSPPRVAHGEDIRVAYFHHAFPLLSETFIQREVLALRRAGLALEVFSLYRAEPGTLDETAHSLALGTHYLEPGEFDLRSAAVRRFLRRCPLTCAKLFLYTLFRQHKPHKSWRTDQELLARALALAVAAEKWGATQLHSPWASPDAFTALLASRLLRIPYTMHVRASDLHRPYDRPGLVERLRHASHIVTNSEYNERILTEMLSSFRRRPPILRVYNGLDLLEYRPIDAPPVETGPPLVLSVGRIIEAKGFEHLVRACAVLKEQGRALRCEIIGAAPKEEPNYFLRLLKLRRALRLEGEIEFVGVAPPGRVRARYAEAAVFVLPSVITADGTGDVTPNVVIEAMATGLAVISTRSRAIPELVEDGVSGLLVEPGDVGALAAAIARVLDDPGLTRRLGRNARARVEQRFDIHRNTRKLLALFRGELDHGKDES